MTTYLAQALASYLPFILVPLAIGLIIVAVVMSSKSMESGNSEKKSGSFFGGLFDEIRTEFGQTQANTQVQKPVPKNIKGKPKNINTSKNEVIQEHKVVVSPIEIEPDDNKNDFLDEIMQDEDIVTKLVLGEMIMTPRARQKNIRRLF
jgi:hypothetical protein